MWVALGSSFNTLRAEKGGMKSNEGTTGAILVKDNQILLNVFNDTSNHGDSAFHASQGQPMCLYQYFQDL